MYVRDMSIATVKLIHESSPLLKPQGAQGSLSAAGCPRVGAEDAVVIHIPVKADSLIISEAMLPLG